MNARSCVVTGSASGIGAAIVSRLRSSGWQVCGVDRAHADVTADLSTEAGCLSMIRPVAERFHGALDALVTCAGISEQSPRTLLVNYLGAVRTLRGLRPLLENGSHPRALAIGSLAATFAIDRALEETCLLRDEAESLGYAQHTPPDLIYATSKAALTKWVRRNAIEPEWAGQGILLNVIAPGFVDTPLTRERFKNAQFRQRRDEVMRNLVADTLTPDDIGRSCNSR